MKIVALDTAPLADLPEDLERLNELGDFIRYPSTPPGKVVERLRGAEVAIVNKVALGNDELEQLPDLRLICVAATGTNNIDHVVASAKNIPVRNVTGYSTESVALLTTTSYFTLATDLIHLNQSVYDGTYAGAESFTYWRRPFHQLTGARFGIIGLGNIGRRVAELATAFGAEVVYHSTSGKNTDGPYPHLSLQGLLESSDAVSIHSALLPRTRHLIATPELKSMKSSAHLLNFARGGIVHENDLVQAINDGEIAGAAVDAFSTEPLPHDHVYHRIQDRSRLLVTPHVGWASIEARRALIRGIYDNIAKGY